MITPALIEAQTRSQVYKRGVRIYKSGMILKFKHDIQDSVSYVRAEVRGSDNNSYKVEMAYNQAADKFRDYICECPAYETYDGMCKHCVAVALQLMEYLEQNELPVTKPAVIQRNRGEADGDTRLNLFVKKTDPVLARLMAANALRDKVRYVQADITGRVELVPVFWHNKKIWNVGFQIGIDYKYVLKNISHFVNDVKEKRKVSYGKLSFFHEHSAFTPVSVKLVEYLEDYMANGEDTVKDYMKSVRGWYGDGSLFKDAVKRRIPVSGERFVRLAHILAGRSCTLEEGITKRQIEFVEEDPVLELKIEDTADNGYQLRFPGAEIFVGIKDMCVRLEDKIHICTGEYSENMREYAGLFGEEEKTYYISREDAPCFCAFTLPALDKCMAVKKPGSLEEFQVPECRIRVELDREEGMILASACASYGEHTYNLWEPVPAGEMYRDIEKECAVRKELDRVFPEYDEKKQAAVLPESMENAVYDFLSSGIGRLQQLCEVYISEAMKRINILPPARMAVGVSLNVKILDIIMSSEQFPAEELEMILGAYKRKRRFYRLKDGSFLNLEKDTLAAVAELADGLHADSGQLAAGHIMAPQYRSFYLDQVLEEAGEGLQIRKSPRFQELIQDLNNVESSTFTVPDSLSGQLRPYQKFGFRWMMTLDKLGFGGILADDMGLGKTVQAIAYLLAKRAEGLRHGGRFRSLIVCPASLVYNWENEVRRFAPDLGVGTAAGTAAQRQSTILNGEWEVLLTSYDLLKRDSKSYQEMEFDCMILDEAQNIKNYNTQAAKAVKAVNSAQRFALTGTPIENSLSELWSIFDFLMPGILDSYKKFKINFEHPIVSQGNQEVSERLKKMIKPYILRRLKADVLEELPDKIEETIYSRMEKKQREIYAASLQRFRSLISQQSADDFHTGKLQILAELMKLRQLCCDPSLVYSNYEGGAAKMDTCMDLIRSAVDAGSQLLVFSQFTSLLDLLKSRLDREKIQYYVLTGSTPKKERNRLVEAFNDDGTPVFLISLKAGGTGLNLTSANVVIHLDPWWNMAAQNQATDRAHRIGQNRIVTVYKLIMKDTIEESILKLQQAKAQLSEDIITDGSIRDVLAGREEFMRILGGME